MDNSLATLNWIAVLPLGIALHWSLPAVQGGRPGRSVAVLVLSIAAWLLMMAGILGPIMVLGGPLGLLLVIAFFGVAIMMVDRYRDAEGRSLLWFLAVAAERQGSLAEAARSFAAQRTDEMGRRAELLAVLLESGVPLPDALKQSKNRLPLDAQLATRLGYETGQLAVTLKEAARDGGRFASIWDPFCQRLLYLIVVVGFGLVLIFAFLNVVLPNLHRIFQDFDIELPPLTQTMSNVSWFVVAFAPLIAWSLLLLLGILLFVALLVLGKVHWEPRPVAWFTRRYHGALVLESLAQAVDLRRPLDEMFDRLGDCYPRGHVRRSLQTVAGEIGSGMHWCAALEKSGLISAADAAVLRAAERVDNLPWALREMSHSAMRRLATRMNVGVSLGIPAAVLAFGAVVGVLVVAALQPLAKLIYVLS